MRFRSIRTSLMMTIMPTITLAMVFLSLLGYFGAKQTIENNAQNEMKLDLSIASKAIAASLSNNRLVLLILTQKHSVAVFGLSLMLIKGNNNIFLPIV